MCVCTCNIDPSTCFNCKVIICENTANNLSSSGFGDKKMLQSEKSSSNTSSSSNESRNGNQNNTVNYGKSRLNAFFSPTAYEHPSMTFVRHEYIFLKDFTTPNYSSFGSGNNENNEDMTGRNVFFPKKLFLK